MAGLIPPIVTQLEELKTKYPQARWEEVPGGMVRVVVPAFPLPSGWSKTHVTVQFILPVGYPVARPDCFWCDPDLRLEGGKTPQATGTNQMPGTNEPLLWFSWHVDKWSPTDDAIRWTNVIRQRFEQRS